MSITSVSSHDPQVAAPPLAAIRAEAAERPSPLAFGTTAFEWAGALPVDVAGLLERPSAPLSIPELLELASAIAGSRIWQSAVRHDWDERHPVRLVADGGWEAWVIGWTPGQAVELHDHGGARGALAVTEGVLTEVFGRYGSERRLLAAGSTCALPEALVHDVLNTSSDLATSVHVYSPPLRSMTYYDPVDGSAVRTERVEPFPSVLGAAPSTVPQGAVL